MSATAGTMVRSAPCSERHRLLAMAHLGPFLAFVIWLLCAQEASSQICIMRSGIDTTACCDRVAQEVEDLCMEYELKFGFTMENKCRLWVTLAREDCITSCLNCSIIGDGLSSQCRFSLTFLGNAPMIESYCQKSISDFVHYRCPTACEVDIDYWTGLILPRQEQHQCNTDEGQQCMTDCGNYQTCRCRTHRGLMRKDTCEGSTVLTGPDELNPGMNHSCERMPTKCHYHSPEGYNPDLGSCGRKRFCKTDFCLVKQVECPPVAQCIENGVCDPDTGHCHYANKVQGVNCSDGKSYTFDDQCTGTGVCLGQTDYCLKYDVTCEPVNSCHLGGKCDSATGKCTYTNKPDGSPCDDGRAFTVEDYCQSGLCVGRSTDLCAEAAVICQPPNPCFEPGFCDPRTGACSTPVPLDWAKPCDDADPLTWNDTCVDGVCLGAPVQGPQDRTIITLRIENMHYPWVESNDEVRNNVLIEIKMALTSAAGPGLSAAVALAAGTGASVEARCTAAVPPAGITPAQLVSKMNEQDTRHSLEVDLGERLRTIPGIDRVLIGPLQVGNSQASLERTDSLGAVSFLTLGVGICTDREGRTMASYGGDVLEGEAACKDICLHDPQCAAFNYAYPLCSIYGTVRIRPPRDSRARWFYQAGSQPVAIAIEKASPTDEGQKATICRLKGFSGDLVLSDNVNLSARDLLGPWQLVIFFVGIGILVCTPLMIKNVRAYCKPTEEILKELREKGSDNEEGKGVLALGAGSPEQFTAVEDMSSLESESEEDDDKYNRRTGDVPTGRLRLAGAANTQAAIVDAPFPPGSAHPAGPPQPLTPQAKPQVLLACEALSPAELETPPAQEQAPLWSREDGHASLEPDIIGNSISRSGRES